MSIMAIPTSLTTSCKSIILSYSIVIFREDKDNQLETTWMIQKLAPDPH
jgi:hypothetical protein